jgi:hypothetical protein
VANKFREFDANDWCSFAGATPFEDASEPLILVDDIETPDGWFGINIDRNGIEIQFIGNGEEFEQKVWSLHRGELTKESMKLLAEHIDPISMDLEGLGFERIV